ncbi:hypothetical protein Taro_015385 [Colocasia esculenta]|uniref:Reticulon-like protein n=1 Tax=Colocasia esculenta TaxID=4460 RepID=A0A843UBC3_COLES|nr:hypothetical protein [Colocasia esculenta]
MAEHAEDAGSAGESLLDKITEKLHGHGSSSSSDSDSEKPETGVAAAAASIRAKVWRLFGREQPVHKVFGGGQPADVFLWRNKKISAGVLTGATAIWVLFELIEYHLLSLVCHCLILALAILFLWSNATTFVHKSSPRIPEVQIPEDLVVNIARSLSYEINHALTVLRDVALGRDIRKFLAVIAGLWVLSLLGNCCNFLTLFYIVFVFLHTVPVLYEKYEDKVDAFGEKAMIEFKKQYAVFDAKVLSKILKGPLKDKKH